MIRKAAFRNMPVRWKFTVVSMAITTITLMLTAMAMLAANLVHLRKQMLNDIEQRAGITGRNCSAALIFNDQATATEILSSMAMQKEVRRTALYNKNGDIFVTYNRKYLLPRPFPPAPRGGWGGRIEGGLVLAEEPILFQGQNAGTIYVEMDQNELYQNIRWAAITTAGVLTLALAAAFVVSIRLQGFITRPISDLAQAAQEVSASKDFSVRVREKGGDELGDLISVFNKMLGELQEREARIAKNTEELENMVQRRTEQLTQTNKMLTDELAERKIMERQLIKAQEEAVEATRLKDKFVSLVSHDLRSPLASVTSGLDLFANKHLGELDESQVGFAKKMIRSLEGLSRMIDELLDVSRLRTGAIRPNMAFNDARAVVRSVMEKLEHLATEKGIRLENHVPDKRRIFADTALLTAAIQNLVTNAIKFSRKGDVVKVFIPEGKQTTIAVADTGTGIGPDLLPRLFVAEKKTTMLGTAGEKGTGLGLPYCKDIVEAHGGTITVESEPEKGSAFYLEFPPISALLLVVDDQPGVRKEIISSFAGTNIKVIEAENGEEALSILSVLKPNVLLTDITMPVMDGFTLLKRVRESEQTKLLPVIVMTTAGNDTEMRKKAFKMGANEFVAKPLDEQDIVCRVMKFID